jgi:hypothetical protein
MGMPAVTILFLFKGIFEMRALGTFPANPVEWN